MSTKIGAALGWKLWKEVEAGTGALGLSTKRMKHWTTTGARQVSDAEMILTGAVNLYPVQSRSHANAS
jgi:hypothetical protein